MSRGTGAMKRANRKHLRMLEMALDGVTYREIAEITEVPAHDVAARVRAGLGVAGIRDSLASIKKRPDEARVAIASAYERLSDD